MTYKGLLKKEETPSVGNQHWIDNGRYNRKKWGK